jgi:hypothetical protein
MQPPEPVVWSDWQVPAAPGTGVEHDEVQQSAPT